MKFIQPEWPAPLSIKAYTTVRSSWGESNPHADCDFHENNALKTLLNLPSDPIWMKQTHSTIAVPALASNIAKEADAAFSNQANHICAVLTADCLPILICNQQGTHVAAVHAGWRGLANGVIETTLAALNQPAADLLIWLGPAIGPTKFEVGKDVYDAFILNDPQATTAFSAFKEGKWLADLYALAKRRLHKQGVTHIYGGNYCTYTQEELFFSYRRDKGKTGRMASLIWVEG